MIMDLPTENVHKWSPKESTIYYFLLCASMLLRWVTQSVTRPQEILNVFCILTPTCVTYLCGISLILFFTVSLRPLRMTHLLYNYRNCILTCSLLAGVHVKEHIGNICSFFLVVCPFCLALCWSHHILFSLSSNSHLSKSGAVPTHYM